MKALDLFCGAGGASAGLRRAGFELLGVDIRPQPRYPFAIREGNVFDLIESGDLRLDAFDFIWASPPCQGKTAYRRRPNHVRPVDTDGNIVRIRALLAMSNVPWVIENVPGTALRAPITLCGSMFSETLMIRRHRCFEASFSMPQLACRHELQLGDFPQATNRKNRRRTAEIGVWRIPIETQRSAMGINWMALEELSEAIPPAFAEWIGVKAIAYLNR